MSFVDLRLGIPLLAPAFHIHVPALFGAFFAEVVLGYFWYGRWFGKTLANELGFSPNLGPMPSLLRRARILRWLFLMTTILMVAFMLQLIRPSTWNAGADGPSWVYGLVIAVGTWAGFCATPLLSRVAWEGASWRLVRIHAGYHLAGLLVVGQILAIWH